MYWQQLKLIRRLVTQIFIHFNEGMKEWMNLGWIYILYSLPFHMNHTQICILFFHFFVLCLRFRPSFIMIVRCNTVQFNGLSQMSVMYATSPPRVGALTACQLYNEIRWEEEVIMRTNGSSNTSIIHKHIIAWLGLCRIVSIGGDDGQFDVAVRTTTTNTTQQPTS